MKAVSCSVSILMAIGAASAHGDHRHGHHNHHHHQHVRGLAHNVFNPKPQRTYADADEDEACGFEEPPRAELEALQAKLRTVQLNPRFRGRSNCGFCVGCQQVDMYFHFVGFGDERTNNQAYIADPRSVYDAWEAGEFINLSDLTTPAEMWASIDDAMVLLNEEFSESPFRFVAANRGSTTITLNNEWVVDPKCCRAEIDAALNVGQNKYTMNVYMYRSASGSAGFAFLPYDGAFRSFDGVHISYYTLNVASSSGRQRPGYTLVHEVGHYMGLLHTFTQREGVDPCDPNQNDFVADTPAMNEPSDTIFGGSSWFVDCQAVLDGSIPHPDTCPSAGVDPLFNHMNYPFDVCLQRQRNKSLRLTCGQITRMSEQWQAFRAPPGGPTPSTDDDSTDDDSTDDNFGGGGGAVALCFPRDGLVHVKNKGLIALQDLSLGDLVLVDVTATGGGKYEPVYSFGHRLADVPVHNYLQITTSGGAALTLSQDHMVFVVAKGGQDSNHHKSHVIPASQVQLEDTLELITVNTYMSEIPLNEFHQRRSLVNVTDIQTVMARGIYAPFTPSGSIVVNGIKTSTYSSLQGTERIEIWGVPTSLTHQWLNHLLLVPFRLFCNVHQVNEDLQSRCTQEEYQDGVSTWLYRLWQFYYWWFSDERSIAIQILLSLVFVVWVGVMIAMDVVLQYPFSAIWLVGIYSASV